MTDRFWLRFLQLAQNQSDKITSQRPLHIFLGQPKKNASFISLV